MNDSFRTVKSPVTAEYKEKNSRFIAYVYPVKQVEEIKMHEHNLRVEHYKAVHVCYAWRLGLLEQSFRANDDGEPSGTAGKPILGRIDSWQITNVVVFVVRYFGGVKLGTGGLIQAYKAVADMALTNAEIIIDFELDEIEINIRYEQVHILYAIIPKFEAKIVAQNIDVISVFTINIRKSKSAEFMQAIHDSLL